MALNKAVHIIQKRDKPSDRFYTPDIVARKCIGMIDHRRDFRYGEEIREDIWYEPFKGLGAYYDKFPCKDENKRWSEIDLGKDAFEFNEKIDIICTNPPYSKLNDCFDMAIKLKPRVIQFLLGVMNVTIPRLNKMSNAGYYLKKMHYVNIKGWFGVSVICQWEIDNDGNTRITHSKETIKKSDGSGYEAVK